MVDPAEQFDPKQEENHKAWNDALAKTGGNYAQANAEALEKEIAESHLSPEQIRVRDLEAALLVYDVTLACLLSFSKPPDIFAGQCRAAVEAYQFATGEDSMAAKLIRD